MDEKGVSEREWVYNYLQGKKSPLPVIIGTRGTWGINGKRAIILFVTMPVYNGFQGNA